MIDAIKRYANQPSTYKGIGLLLSIIGVTVAPGAVEAIGTGIIAAIAIYETLRDEKRNDA